MKKSGMIFIKLKMLVMAFLIFTISCTKEEAEIPQVATLPVKDVACTGASSGGDVLCDGGAPITARGVCWSISKNPTTDDHHTTDGKDKGRFSSVLAGLSENTTWYLRAYATNEAGTAYGESVSFTTAQGCGGTIEDIDGNVYKVVAIGRQTWMAENLRTTNYNDGSPGLDRAGLNFHNFFSGVYSYPEHDSVYSIPYGALYNYYAVETGKLCPKGWHVPSNAEWNELKDYIGEKGFLGKEGKTIKSTTGWAQGGNGLDVFGFNALPAGLIYTGLPIEFGWLGSFWTSTPLEAPLDNFYVKTKRVASGVDKLYEATDHRSRGLSVRCIKN